MTSELTLDLSNFGYADGGYIGKCSHCKASFTGDKRAWSCKSCAEKKALEPKTIRATPSTDPLAGLMRWKHCEYPNQHKMMEHKDGEYILHSEAAAIFSFLNTSLDDSKQSRDDWKNLAISLSGELEKAKKEINTLLNNYVREHFFENKTFQPLSDLIGQISQLDNAITITRDFKNRAETAEREVEQCKTLLEDRDAVHVAMLRGDIAKPTIEQICHVYAGTLQAKSDGKAEFNIGYVIACCNLINLHGADIAAVDTLKQLGITRTEIDAMDLSEYDLSALMLLDGHFGGDQIYAPEDKE